ncbi:uncharacterized protein Z520_10983 [Fonsecaea multimorphosa CBS 102226]|uniref:Alpha/beta hydrolase domain-containing protein n=1 Tax=Fonsecaea multimorphosa CBS 102226 TaxID=1442371 RepID=A0A0D2GUX5_9EURO|nr:uncharacterized protein Z520_10983 [Fonsecaea multimorphosa CBS 102226]KIX93340.1 hypothetical protein Z520_10983 [Fonsecaea multimorphosa CBS 102226]OAL18577.1 hypothetical protein AYO22_10554 [Fonsecaea multimorphosa]
MACSSTLPKLVLSLLVFYISSVVSASSIPTVEGPITGGIKGYPFGAPPQNVTPGYFQEEYFLSNNATRYNSIGNLSETGVWTITPSTSAPYKTRIVVQRPANASKFNGDVIVEWINVSSGFDIMIAKPPGIYEAGYVYVGISAQFVGIIGAPPHNIGLTEWDPERYGTLSIPDDGLSYDIYTQLARLLQAEASGASGQPLVLGGLKPKHIIGIGVSQSGGRVLAYANGVQQLENVYHVIMPLLCGGEASDFSSAPAQPNLSDFSFAFPSKVRPDLKIPVMEIASESEALNYFVVGSRQPDTQTFRYWEVAGASHFNTPLLEQTVALTTFEGVPFPVGNQSDDVSWLPTLDAAYRHVSVWLRTGTPPPSMPKIQIAYNGSTPMLARNKVGNVIGGIRLPEITVPIASYIGLVDGVSLVGSTTPFSPALLKQLYPNHTDYVKEVTAAAAASLASGVILPYRVQQYDQQAQSANIPPQ